MRVKSYTVPRSQCDLFVGVNIILPTNLALHELFPLCLRIHERLVSINTESLVEHRDHGEITVLANLHWCSSSSNCHHARPPNWPNALMRSSFPKHYFFSLSYLVFVSSHTFFLTILTSFAILLQWFLLYHYWMNYFLCLWHNVAMGSLYLIWKVEISMGLTHLNPCDRNEQVTYPFQATKFAQ